MSDIVERLRSWEDALKHHYRDANDASHNDLSMVGEAADEIERLRRVPSVREMKTLMEENRALREKLEKAEQALELLNATMRECL
jgi:hypothetical protein